MLWSKLTSKMKKIRITTSVIAISALVITLGSWEIGGAVRNHRANKVLRTRLAWENDAINETVNNIVNHNKFNDSINLNFRLKPVLLFQENYKYNYTAITDTVLSYDNGNVYYLTNLHSKTKHNYTNKYNINNWKIYQDNPPDHSYLEYTKFAKKASLANIFEIIKVVQPDWINQRGVIASDLKIVNNFTSYLGSYSYSDRQTTSKLSITIGCQKLHLKINCGINFYDYRHREDSKPNTKYNIKLWTTNYITKYL